MRKSIFVWALLLILLSWVLVSSQTIPKHAPQNSDHTLKLEARIDSLELELERVKQNGYEKAIESANRSISISNLVLIFVSSLAVAIGIFGYFRIREIKADYKETKSELKKSFEDELERVREYKREIAVICDEMKEKRKYVDEETDSILKHLKAQEREIPADFTKEVSELVPKASREAIEGYEKVLDKIFDKGVYRTMAYNYFVENKYDESIAECKKAVRLNPRDHRAYTIWGIALGELGRYDEAIEKYQKATALKSDYALGYYNWGTALSELDRHHEALEKYMKALELNPDYAPAHYGCGFSLGNLGKNEEGIERYRKAVEVDPDYVDAYFAWGRTLSELGKHAEALEKYKKVVELKPDHEKGWYNLACSYSLINKKKESLESLKRAIELQPANKEEAKEEEDFKNLWEDGDFKKLVE